MLRISKSNVSVLALSLAVAVTGAMGCEDSTTGESLSTGAGGASGASTTGVGGAGTGGKATGGSSGAQSTGGAGGTAGAKGGAAGATGGTTGGTGGGAGAAASVTDTPAAGLRTAFNLLLEEHMFYAAKATGAALGGRSDEATAYINLLNKNGDDIGSAIGMIFDADAEAKFNGIWSAHNGLFVQYTGVVAAGSDKTDVKNKLETQYIAPFSTFISDATGLPVDAVRALVEKHVTMTEAVIDDQNAALEAVKSGSGAAAAWTKAYASLNASVAHMKDIADAVSEAIVDKKADVFPGDPKAPGVDLRVGLNLALAAHLYLASLATDAALNGHADEFGAAGDALNANGDAIGTVIGSIYGDAAATQFNGIWSAHNGLFVDYTTGVATHDDNKKAAALASLKGKGYAEPFRDFLAGATDIAPATLEALIVEHVTTTAAVIDAQDAAITANAAMDPTAMDKATAAAMADDMAGKHMEKIGDPLAGAIVKKVPSKF